MTPRLIVHLDGFEGPLDLLLELARAQKVDLARISVLSLVEQFLAIVEGEAAVGLEVAGDWLVMAAWLIWLKSRLLLPPGPEADEGEDAAGMLTARLDELERMQHVARLLSERPQLGHEVFPRGAPERLVAVDRTALAADVAGLVRGYMAARRRANASQSYQPKPLALWTVADALAQLERMLNRAVGWTPLNRFLPRLEANETQQRAAMAGTLLAGLELARAGGAFLRQEEAFGPITVRARNAA